MVGAVGVLLWEFVGGIFTAFGQMIAGILRMVIGVFQIFFGVIVGLFTGNWTMLGEGLKNFFGGIFQVLSAIVTAAWLFIKTVLGLIWEILAGVLGMVIDAFYKIVTWFVDTFMPDMKKPWTDLATWLDTTWNGVVDGILLILKPLTDVLDGIIKKIAEIAKNPVGAIFGEGNPTGSSAGHWEGLPFISKWIAGYAEGGFVPNTGLAMLHAGEYVVPRSGMLVSESGGGGVNTVNVYANVSNDVDMRQLADEIARIWYSDFNRRRV
jgi:phage-related protein